MDAVNAFYSTEIRYGRECNRECSNTEWTVIVGTVAMRAASETVVVDHSFVGISFDKLVDTVLLTDLTYTAGNKLADTAGYTAMIQASTLVDSLG